MPADDLRTILDIPRQDFNRVAATLFAYLFGIINRREYIAIVDDALLSRATLKAVKSSGYVLKNCKLFAYAYWCARQTGENPPRASQYNISVRDANFLKRLNLQGVGTEYYAFTLDEYDQLLDSVMGSKTLEVYTGKYVSKKMAFLIKSYGVRRSDLEESMMTAALKALYKQYPRYESKLHVVNICKTTIHNTGMNLIQYHTRAKRQALVKDESGLFTAVNVPMSEIVEMPAETPHPYRDSLQSLVALEHRMSEQVRRFLTAAAGKYDEGLSKFLGIANDDAVETMPYQKYLSRLQDYFQVTPHQTERLFERLRPHIA